jgi:hypothetical protein
VSSNDHLYRFSAALGATAAGMALSTSLALATGGGGYEGSEGSGYGDSAQIEITGEIPQKCEFTELPTDTALGALATGLEKTLGNLAYVCNFAVSTNITIEITSQNGALKRDGGSETVSYEASWALYNAGAFVDASTWYGGDDFQLPSGLNGVPKTGVFMARVTGSTTGLPAGTYEDTLTFEISP